VDPESVSSPEPAGSCIGCGCPPPADLVTEFPDEAFHERVGDEWLVFLMDSPEAGALLKSHPDITSHIERYMRRVYGPELDPKDCGGYMDDRG
jgi:hypothetical protein